MTMTWHSPKRRALLLATCGVALATSPGASQSRSPLDAVRPDTIRAHMTFLADDLLEGRGTGSRGFELAAKYVAAQFAATGLEPGGVNGTYYQPVRFLRTTPVPQKTSFSLISGAKQQPLEWGLEFVARGNALRSPISIAGPVLFVGYGVSAPEYGHDDYAADVRGAIVAFLPGVPAAVPMERRDYYTSVKWAIARQRGAVATIELSTPLEDQTWAWEDRISWVTHGASSWLEVDGRFPAQQELPRILLSSAGTARLLATADRTIADVISEPRRLALADTVLTIVATHEYFSSPHVLGIVRGRDPTLRDEYVVYTAHLDGMGRGNPVNGDAIYKSAIDNALGSAISLTLAEAFASATEGPRRSVLFLATTGEELGIQGSPYFVEHSTIPIMSIVAAINIDGPSLLTGPVNSVMAMGAQNSTLGDSVRTAAQQLGLGVRGATAPLNYSDHYPFIMKGIPALWIVADDGSSPNEARDAARRSIHMPMDDMNRSFRWDAAVTLARLNFLVGHEVANALERPRWNPGDVLGEMFAQPPAK